MKKSDFEKIVEEEIHFALKEWEQTKTKSDLEVDRFAKKNQPILNKNIEYMQAVLKMIPKASSDYRTVQSILDDALALREPTAKQMGMISAILGKYLRENKGDKAMKKKTSAVSKLRAIIREELKKSVSEGMYGIGGRFWSHEIEAIKGQDMKFNDFYSKYSKVASFKLVGFGTDQTAPYFLFMTTVDGNKAYVAVHTKKLGAGSSNFKADQQISMDDLWSKLGGGDENNFIVKIQGAAPAAGTSTARTIILF